MRNKLDPVVVFETAWQHVKGSNMPEDRLKVKQKDMVLHMRTIRSLIFKSNGPNSLYPSIIDLLGREWMLICLDISNRPMYVEKEHVWEELGKAMEDATNDRPLRVKERIGISYI